MGRIYWQLYCHMLHLLGTVDPVLVLPPPPFQIQSGLLFLRNVAQAPELFDAWPITYIRNEAILVFHMATVKFLTMCPRQEQTLSHMACQTTIARRLDLAVHCIMPVVASLDGKRHGVGLHVYGGRPPVQCVFISGYLRRCCGRRAMGLEITHCTSNIVTCWWPNLGFC